MMNYGALKQRFEKMASELASEYSQQSVEFAGCEARIEALKQELAVVAPQFFKSNPTEGRALPQAIAGLPDEAGSLKALMAEYYQWADNC